MVKTDSKDKQIEELKKQIEELTNNWKRALADYQNLEKNFSRQKETLALYIKRDQLIKFFPILEILQKAQEHLKDHGLEMAIKEFNNLLKSEGVEEIEVLGHEFDPNTSECVDTETLPAGRQESEKDNIVTKVVSNGYKILGTVIRPAKVVVIKKEVNKKAEELAEKA